MKRGTSAALACATVAGGLFAASPAKADTRSAAQSAVDKVAAGATLTQTDKDALRAQVASVVGYSSPDIDKAFAAYDQGDASLLAQLPGRSDETVVEEATGTATPMAGAATAGNDWGIPCQTQIGGFTVTSRLYGLIFGETIASFSQHVESLDNCVCLWPPSFRQDWGYNITGNGSFAGWSFDRVTKLSNIDVKYGACGGNGAHDWFAQAQFIQAGKIAGSWNPWVRSRRMAAAIYPPCGASNPDAAWWTNAHNSQHNICVDLPA